MAVNLKQEESTLQKLLTNSSAVCYIKDQNGRFVFVNEAFTTIFGVKQAEAIGKTDSDLQPEKLVKIYKANDQKVREKRSPITFKEEVMVKGQKKIFISHKFPVTNLPEHPNAVGGISIEITQLGL